MNILDIEAPLIAAVNGPVRLHSEFVLLADIILATPSAVFRDKHILNPALCLAMASICCGRKRSAQYAGAISFSPARSSMPGRPRNGAVNEIVTADKPLPRAREIAEGLAKLPSLTTKYTRIALTQKLRRIIDEASLWA